MEQRPLGTTGLQVSELGFGCGAVGGLMVKGDPSEQRTAVQRALDAVAPVIGALVGSVAEVPGPVLGLLLALFAGVFIAIGAGHLLPEAEQHRPGVAPTLVGLAAVGAVVVVVIRTLLG